MNLPFKVPEAKDQRSETTLNLKLKTVTPILGGGVFARELDDCEVIRVPSIRGQLRFWWRAQCDGPLTPSELKEKETALWGGLGTGKEATPTRSRVRISVGEVTKKGVVQEYDPKYILWPAETDGSQLWQEGIEFELKIQFPAEYEVEIEQTLSAWLCFGGYGSRTRRGVGKVSPACPKSYELVPEKSNEEQIKALLGGETFTRLSTLSDWPRMRGIKLAVGKKVKDAQEAWKDSTSWLKEFRTGKDPKWPETTQIRPLNQSQQSAPSKKVLPRASLGLPIDMKKPENYSIGWVEIGKQKPHDRLASPLITGCMPLHAKEFVPFALWLGRGYPMERKAAVFKKTNEKTTFEFDADFDDLGTSTAEIVQIGQEAENGYRMRTAFFAWLQKRPNVQLLGSSEVSS